MDADYQRIIDQIKSGQLPSVTGCHFSQVQINEIEAAIKARYSEMTAYFTSCITSRLDQTIK